MRTRDQVPARFREKTSPRVELLPILLVVLYYACSIGFQAADGLEHLHQQIPSHATGPHFEDPLQQSHGDRCLIARPGCTIKTVAWNDSIIRIQGESRDSESPGLPQIAQVRHPDLPHSRAPPLTRL
jgi:hypothetical protein